VSEFGAGIAGGISLLLLRHAGRQPDRAVVQANGTFRDIGAQVQYMNARERWNWGASPATCRT
jgi:hypothetical protein